MYVSMPSISFSGLKVSIGEKIYVFKGFKFLQILGRGANAVVLKAEQPILNRLVAVKIWVKMKPYDLRDKKRQGIEESIKLGKLNHDNICKIHTVDIKKDILYAVLEYIDGKTLYEILINNPALNNRLHLWRQIASALEYSYKAKIYHGDMHAENILVCSDSTVKICDFGTSLFTGRAFSQKREVNRLIKLAEQIFHEFKINDFIEVDLRCLSAFQVLRILDYWVEIILSINNKKLEEVNKNEVFDILFSMVQAPVFNFDLLKKIKQFRKYQMTNINTFYSLLDAARTGSGKGFFSTFSKARSIYIKWREEYLTMDINTLDYL